MKSDRELVCWLQRYVQDILDLQKDLRNGLALIAVVETLSGLKYPHCINPSTYEECHRNCTIALMGIFNLFEDLEVEICAEDIVNANIDKIRELLNAMASDEWETGQQWPEDAFSIESCDLTSYDINSIIMIQAAYRAHKNKSIVKKARQRLQHFQKLLKEFLDTERNYVGCLETIITVYKEQLEWKCQMAQKADKEPELVSKAEIDLIFSNINSIYECNKAVLEEFENRLSGKILTFDTNLADIMIRFAPYFSVYTHYFNNYESSNVLLDKGCITIQMKESSSGNTLESLLITPVQRLPRYVLLLKELYNSTHPDHPHYKQLEIAIADIQKQASTLNKNMQKSQAAYALVLVQQKLVGDCVPNFVSPSRFFVNEATFKLITLDSKHGKNFEYVHLFLFNDAVIITKKINSSAYRYWNAIRLDRATRIKDIPDLGHIYNVFNIISARATITIKCSTNEQKLEWMQTMSSLIAQNLETTRSRTILMAPKEMEQELLDPSTRHKTATITGTKQAQDSHGKAYTVYCILVTTFDRNTNFTVYHRYREFDALSKQLKKKFPDVCFIELPRKHMLDNLKAETVHARQIVLETFLEDILSLPNVRSCSEFVIFLTPSDNYSIPIEMKKATKLKTPSHLKKKKKRSHRARRQSSCTIDDIYSKMDRVDDLESLLPQIKPRVENEASPAVVTNMKKPLPPLPTIDNIPSSPGPIFRKKGGRGRGRGRGRNRGGGHIPTPYSPRVIRLRAPTIIGPPPVYNDNHPPVITRSGTVRNTPIASNLESIFQKPLPIPELSQSTSSVVRKSRKRRSSSVDLK